MILEAPVVKFTDKRVDKIIKKLGYKAVEVFYSPIIAALYYLALLLLTIFPMIFFIWDFFEYKYFWYLSIFILVSYLLNAFLNNSIVLTNKEIIIVNPNFPFKKQTIINMLDIDSVVLDKSKKIRWSSWFFGVLGGNYIEINTQSKKHLFFCIYLDVECYDEHLTGKTLDDLHFSLKKMNIPVTFNEGNLI